MAESENCDSNLSFILPETSDCVTDVFLLDGLDLMLDGHQLEQPEAMKSEHVQFSSTDVLTDSTRVEEAHDELFAKHAVDLLDIKHITTLETAGSNPPDTIDSTDNELPLKSEAFDFILQNVNGCSEKNEFQTLQPLDVDNIDENHEAPASVVIDSMDCSLQTVVLNVNAAGSSNVKPTIPYQAVPILPKDPNHGNSISRGRQRKKVKVYELPEFTDKEREKKRMNAINARNNRLRKKEEMEELRENLQKAIEERDRYKAELKVLKETNNDLEKRLGIIEEAVKFRR